MPRPVTRPDSKMKSHRLSPQTIALLPALGKDGNATDGIEKMASAMPLVIQACLRLKESNNPERRALGYLLEEHFGLSEEKILNLSDVEIRDEEGNVIGWVA